MPTLGELAAKFAGASNTDTGDAGENNDAAYESGETKTASEGGTSMKSLTDMYLQLVEKDHEKVAAAAAEAPEQPDFAKLANDLAEAEAQDAVAAGGGEEPAAQGEGQWDYVKVAQEYDAAGRIMARGFYDEFQKLAANVHTMAPANKHTESMSQAKTPTLGERQLPTTPTNFAGNDNHDDGITTKGGKDVYKDSLAPKKKVGAGVTGDDPEAAAISTGGGSPAGFATIKDLMA